MYLLHYLLNKHSLYCILSPKKFLDDLTDADVLVHVLDSSATADAEGNTIVVDADGRDATGSDPMNDLDWVFNELIQWVFMNVQAKWASVVKRGRDKVSAPCVKVIPIIKDHSYSFISRIHS